jgi:DNA-binding GntR family transcriptional regulator
VIYDACGNGFLCRQTEQLRNRLKPYRRMQLHVPHRVAASLREHQVIVDALLASDEAAASEAIRAHVIIQGERFYDFISSMPEHSSEQAVTI